MAKPILGDVFIGNFPVTQLFGENPASYAKFGLAGHNGIDFGLPTGTQVVSATDGKVIEVGYDQYGYGNYVKIWDEKQLCSCIYGHLDHAVVSNGDMVVRGQLIGISDNTGNSTGPHLHFGYCRTDENGKRTNTDNGYSGYIDPNRYATWDIKNLTEPVKPLTQNESCQAELDQVRIQRDENHNDRMACWEELGFTGSFNRTIAVEEIRKLKALEKSYNQKDEKISELTMQIQVMEKKIADQQTALESANQKLIGYAEMQKTVQTLTLNNTSLQKAVQDLKDSIKTPQYQGWRLWLYEVFLKG